MTNVEASIRGSWHNKSQSEYRPNNTYNTKYKNNNPWLYTIPLINEITNHYKQTTAHDT